jgi:integrase
MTMPQQLAQIYPRSGGADAQRLRALVELLLETGLRLGDAVQLRRDNIVNGKLHLRTAKTGAQIRIPLSPHLVEELQLVRNTGENYFFWSGQGKLKSCMGDWQRSLKRLFRIAGINDGCAHRFRHTFAKRYLLAGVPPDRVAVLMGHSTQAITLKHYANWVRERQEQLEADVLAVQEKYARYPLDGVPGAQQVQ